MVKKHNSLQPLPRLYSCKRPLNAMQVYSHSYWLVIFCTTSNGEGELANFREFMEKNTILNEHPVVQPFFGVINPDGKINSPLNKPWMEKPVFRPLTLTKPWTLSQNWLNELTFGAFMLLSSSFKWLCDWMTEQTYVCLGKGLPHIAPIYRNSVVLISFPGIVINTYANFQKTLPRAVSATTRGSQPLVLSATTRGN